LLIARIENNLLWLSDKVCFTLADTAVGISRAEQDLLSYITMILIVCSAVSSISLRNLWGHPEKSAAKVDKQLK
jgi:hypothetical protein